MHLPRLKVLVSLRRVLKRHGLATQPLDLILLLDQQLQRILENRANRAATESQRGILAVKLETLKSESVVVHPHRRNRTPRTDQIETELQSIAVPNDFHHDVRAATLGHLLDLGHRVLLHEVDRDRAKSSRLLQTLRHGVNSVDRVDHGHSASDSAEPDRSAADDDAGELLAVAGVEVLEEPAGGEVARGEDVGHQHEHFLGDGGRGAHAGRVAQRHADVLCLAAVDAVGRQGVAEELALGAARSLAAAAVEAGSAGCVEGDDNLLGVEESAFMFYMMKDS